MPNVWASSFAPREQALLCITTLRHRRFVDDAIQIIGLPVGARLRLRYRRPYVAKDLWDQVSQGAASVPFQVLIALAGADADGSPRYETLRVGNVVKIECTGQILIIDVGLGGFAPDGDGLGSVWLEVQKLTSNIPSALDSGRSSKGDYVQAMTSVPQSVLTSDSVEWWEKSAAGFFRLDASNQQVVRGIPFLYFVEGLPNATASHLKSAGRIRVEAGSRLEWNIHTIVRDDKGILKDPVGEIRVEVSHQAVTMLTSRRIRVDSLRDSKTLTMTTQPSFRISQGHVSIRAILFKQSAAQDTTQASSWQAAGERAEIVISRADLPLTVGRFMPALAALAAGAAAASATLGAQALAAIGADILVPVGTGLLVFLSLYLGFSRSN